MRGAAEGQAARGPHIERPSRPRRWAAMLRQVVPLALLAPTGFAALSTTWRAADAILPGCARVAPPLDILSGLLWLFLLGSYLARGPKLLRAHLSDPALSPLLTLALLSPLLVLAGLHPLAPLAAEAGVVLLGLVGLVLGGFILGQWIDRGSDVRSLNSGFLLPTSASGLVASLALATIGLIPLGWYFFGYGVISDLILGSVILDRLIHGQRLPERLIPTLGIEMAVPVVTGNAYFALHGLTVDPVSLAIAGYTSLIAIAQVRLVPRFARLNFDPSFWGFTFAWAATASYALHWISLERPALAVPLAWVSLAVANGVVGFVVVRTLIWLWRPEAVSEAEVPLG